MSGIVDVGEFNFAFWEEDRWSDNVQMPVPWICANVIFCEIWIGLADTYQATERGRNILMS